MTTCHDRATSGNLWYTYLHWRYAILFYSLLLTLAVGPLSSALGFRANLLELFLAINLLAAVLPLRSRLIRWILLSCLIVAYVVRGGASWLEQVSLVPMSLALWTMVALLATASSLRFALGAQVVDREHLYAGLNAYLLAGVFFGAFYWVIEQTWPGSFVFPGEGVQSPFSLSAAIYYSFVTLATLGYGDIVPRSEMMRGVAILEGIAGQLYLVVMVARLVSLYVSGENKGNS